MDISLIIPHLFHDSFHSLFHYCSVFCHPALHSLQCIESSWVFDLSHPRSTSNSTEENQTDVFEGRICPDLSPCPDEVPSTMKPKESFSQRIEKRKKKHLFILSLRFLYVRGSLSRQLDTNFLSKGWLSCTLAPDNCSKSSFGCCGSIFWPSVQTWSPAISRPEGERFLEYKEMRYSILLWTALWT